MTVKNKYIIIFWLKENLILLFILNYFISLYSIICHFLYTYILQRPIFFKHVFSIVVYITNFAGV